MGSSGEYLPKFRIGEGGEVNRRDFLEMLLYGTAAAAVKPKFYFDVGKNLYRADPQLYALGTVHDLLNSRFIYVKAAQNLQQFNFVSFSTEEYLAQNVTRQQEIITNNVLSANMIGIVQNDCPVNGFAWVQVYGPTV